VVFIFLAAILLLVTTISSPINGDIAILKVMLTNQTHIRHSSVTFGSFGHCILDVPPITYVCRLLITPSSEMQPNFHPRRTDQDFCFPKVIGYKPAVIMAEIDHTTFSKASSDSADALTYAFILHPIACGLAFIAGLAALGGVIGGLISTFIAAVAWIITLVVMAIDFAVFGVSRSSHPYVQSRTRLTYDYPDYQKSCQFRRQRVTRLLLYRHVDHLGSDGLVIFRHGPRLLHLLHGA
jgi:uncharacterized membrane protein